MRRFRPRSTRPGRLWPWLLIWAVLVIVYLVWIGSPKMNTKGATLTHAVTRSTAELSITVMTWRWHGKPVYALSNHGVALTHVNVYNWAEDQLPVLYVGRQLPADFLTKTPVGGPYHVPHLTTMWFVSSAPPPTIFTVTWDAQGKVRFTTIRVRGSNPHQVSNPTPPAQNAASQTAVIPLRGHSWKLSFIGNL